MPLKSCMFLSVISCYAYSAQSIFMQLNSTLELADTTKYYWKKYFQYLNPKYYNENDLKRQVKFLTELGDAALSNEDLSSLKNCTITMTSIFGQAKVCPYEKDNCNLEKEGLSLEPDIENLFEESTNSDELKYYWAAWRNATGAKMKDIYKKYVKLSNLAARANNFTNRGEMWRDEFESPKFVEDIDRLWKQVEPLYDTLHKYVSLKLKEIYKDEIDLSDGMIPAHLLGNMWAQTWTNVAKYVTPYPRASKLNITFALKKKGYDPLRMFQTADEFYQSLGLDSSAVCYNTTKGAIIEKPQDKDIVCHASAWDFSDGQDFRIKMCTKITFDDFVTIHHEMGHIQYYMLYKNQHVTFRTGANPGFHEAIGDTIALSVSSKKHLKSIGLLDNFVESKESDINALMDMALEKIALLPFGLLVDKWRWDVFAGLPPSKWNERWWYYRNNLQKVKEPLARNGESDFDPGAKFHVAADDQYISYFIAHILQFQLYRGLCKAAGEYDPKNSKKPLYKCDFYKSVEAGKKLRAGLSLGNSKHWKEVLKEITGESDYDAGAMCEYFQDLKEALDSLLSKNEPTSVHLVPILVVCIMGAALALGVVLILYKKYKTRRRN